MSDGTVRVSLGAMECHATGVGGEDRHVMAGEVERSDLVGIAPVGQPKEAVIRCPNVSSDNFPNTAFLRGTQRNAD